jgi:Kef-type K+ transport system membrane component KefB
MAQDTVTPATGKEAIVYIVLVCVALVMTTILILTLTLNIRAFVMVFTIYIVGCSAFTFAYLTMKRKDLRGDMRFTITQYLALFNMVFSTCLFVLVIIIATMGSNNSSSYSYR